MKWFLLFALLTGTLIVVTAPQDAQAWWRERCGGGFAPGYYPAPAYYSMPAYSPPLPYAGKGGPDTAGLRERGAYLVNAVVLCADCHTPQDDRGMPDRTRHLQGATLTFRPKKETKNWADESPDITSQGLAGKWGEENMVKFLMTGIDPEGNKARPPMPAFRLNALDARAVSHYLQSLSGGKRSEGPRPEKRAR